MGKIFLSNMYNQNLYLEISKNYYNIKAYIYKLNYQMIK